MHSVCLFWVNMSLNVLINVMLRHINWYSKCEVQSSNKYIAHIAPARFSNSILLYLKKKQVRLTGSIKKILVAAVKLMPTPPAFNDNNMIVGESTAVCENMLITSALRRNVILPSSRTKWKPDCCKGFSRRSKNDENWDTTKLFRNGSSSFSRFSSVINPSTCDERNHDLVRLVKYNPNSLHHFLF